MSKQALKQELESFDKKKLIGSLKLAAGRKAISDFRKFKPSMDSLIDLMLYYVENGVGYTNEFGDIDEGFYSSLESVFKNSLKLIDKGGLHAQYKSRVLGAQAWKMTQLFDNIFILFIMK